ncbi:hypothetical protein TNCV_4978751 [Trichonephila clavipes]|nr:hypothetical protein TNCV_4978751 [Trichonephila clavipes]
MNESLFSITDIKKQLGGLEVACPLRKLEVAGSIPEGVDRHSEWESHRLVCHMIMWHVRDPLSISGDTLRKIKSLQYLAFDESLS